MPFNNLSIGSLQKLFNSLQIDIPNEQLLLPSKHTELAQCIQSYINTASNTPNSHLFIQLLTHIVNNPEDAIEIVQDEICQNILIENRPNDMPHWLLGLMDCQQNLALHLLKIDTYRNSLTLDEFTFLRENYPAVQDLAVKNSIAEPTDYNYSHYSR